MSDAQSIGKIVRDIFLPFLKMEIFFLLAVISKRVELESYIRSHIKADIL